MAKAYKSDVGFFRLDSGDRDDISFHQEIISNDKADTLLVEKSRNTVMKKYDIDLDIVDEMFPS
jgi:hypothetical protein